MADHRTPCGNRRRIRGARGQRLLRLRVERLARREDCRAAPRRDQGQCTFVGPAGRCTERGCLEFHHVVPYASGGPPTVDNIVLRCRSHNQYEAALEFLLFVRERGDVYVGHRSAASNSVRTGSVTPPERAAQKLLGPVQ